MRPRRCTGQSFPRCKSDAPPGWHGSSGWRSARALRGPFMGATAQAASFSRRKTRWWRIGPQDAIGTGFLLHLKRGPGPKPACNRASNADPLSASLRATKRGLTPGKCRLRAHPQRFGTSSEGHASAPPGKAPTLPGGNPTRPRRYPAATYPAATLVARSAIASRVSAVSYRSSGSGSMARSTTFPPSRL
jgi:hypothetical protein